MALVVNVAGSSTTYTYAVANQTFTVPYQARTGGVALNLGAVGGHVDRLRLWPAGTSHSLTPAADVGPAVVQTDGIRWLFTVTPLAAGLYEAQIDYTTNSGGPAVADTNDTLLVLPFDGVLGGSQSLAQVADVRSSTSDVTTSPLAYLFRSHTDAQLLTFLSRASRRVESITGARLVPFTITEEVFVAYDAGNYQPFSRRALVSHTPPARQELWSGSVLSMSLIDPFLSPVGTIPQVTAIDFDSRQGVTRFDAAAAQFSGRARITYTGGYTTVPEDIIEATILLAADAFLVGVDARDGQNDAADLYNRAMSILNPWMRSGADSLGIA